jgi:hypothetical protein
VISKQQQVRQEWCSAHVIYACNTCGHVASRPLVTELATLSVKAGTNHMAP